MTLKSNLFVGVYHVIWCGTLALANVLTTPDTLPADAISIKLVDGILIYAPENITVVEWTTLNLRCFSDIAPAAISWTRNGVTISMTTSLTIDAVNRVDAGEYTCEVVSDKEVYTKNITLDVLYPPELPDIQGPSIVMLNEPFKVTCTADSNPGPVYWWTFDKQDNAPIEKRGQEFELTVFDTVFEVAAYCWVEVTMFPTIGAPITRKSYRVKSVLIHEEAYAWEFPSDYSVGIGDEVYVKCRASGQPTPQIFFTKQGDTSFAQSGPALNAFDVGYEFDGLYTCYAENTVQPTGQPERRISHQRHCRVRVKDPNVPFNCSGYCPHGPPLVTCPITQSVSTELNEKDESVISGDACNDKCGTGIIVAIVLGWVAAVLVLVVLFTLFIWKKRKETSGRQSETKHITMVKMDDQRQSPISSISSNRPEKLETPRQEPEVSQQYSNEGYDEVPGYSSTYLELQGSAQQSRDGVGEDQEQNLYASVKLDESKIGRD